MVDTVARGLVQQGAQVTDATNDALYLATAGRIGSSNMHLSQVSQLLASGQATVWNATLSLTPVIGSAYSAYSGTDPLTGEPLNSAQRGGAAAGAVSQVASLGLLGSWVSGFNPTLFGTSAAPAAFGGANVFVSPGLEAAESGPSVQLSQKGLDLVGNHLAQFGDDAANAGMMQNLQDAYAAGQNVTGANANFYLHEASEAHAIKIFIGGPTGNRTCMICWRDAQCATMV